MTVPSPSPPAAVAPGPAPSGDPVVDVVILTWNDGELLERAVASCAASVGVSVNVIVVDNGSEPPADPGPGAVLLRNEVNRGVAAGRNQGIAAGRSDLVCLLDSDAELTPHALRRLVDELAATGSGLVVPVFAGQPPEASGGRAPAVGRKVARMAGWVDTYRSMGRPEDRPSGGSWPVEFGIGACQLFERRWWETVGGIDDTFFYGPEDVDFCLRLLDAGAAIRQVDGAPVVHPPRRRHRRPIDRAGLRHAVAVIRYAYRHRRRLGAARRAAGAVRRVAGPAPRTAGATRNRPRWWVVVGPGRSGSTVLDGLVAERGAIAVGELVHLWQRVGVEDQLCGCGVRSQACPFWSAVLADALGPEWRDECRRLEALRRRVGGPGSWPLMVARPARWRREATDLIAATARVAAAIEARAGSRPVWDSSKSAVQARLLAEAGRDPSIVVLTRHPAAVAHSWGRPKPRPEAGGVPMPRRGIVGSSMRWSYAVGSGLVEAARRGRTVHHVDYHRLATALDQVDAVPAPSGDELGRWRHAIGGNPVRWDDGPVTVTVDDRWRRAMPFGRRVVATALAGPGLAAVAAARLTGWSRPLGGETTLM